MPPGTGWDFASGRVRLDLTMARNNQVAQSVYESLGWVRDDVFFGYSTRVVRTV
jgi:hypothetical protein